MNKAPVPKDDTRMLSANANAAIQDMMQTIDALRGVLVRETQALENADTDSFMTLQEHKLSVAREYQSGISQLLARKDEIRAADPTLKTRLAAMQTDFHKTAQANHESIERMQRNMKRLGERIMSVARETVKKETQFAYGASGQMQGSGKGSIGINEQA